MFVALILPEATTSTSKRNSSLIVSLATRRTAVRGDSAVLVIDSRDFLSSSAMCSATFGVVSQQPSHDRCFQALNASRPKIGRKHDLGGDNLAEGCSLLGYFHFRWRRRLVGNDSQLAQDRQALLDGGTDDVAHGVVLFRHDVRAQSLDPGVGVVFALAAEKAGGDELQERRRRQAGAKLPRGKAAGRLGIDDRLDA